MGTVRRGNGPGITLLKKAADALDRSHVKVGFFETDKYPDGTPVAYVAAIQEFGYAPGGIPARPFMRPTQQEHHKEWTEAMGQGMNAVAKGRFTVAGVLKQIGGGAAGNVRAKIRSIWQPSLKQSTVDARRRRYSKKSKKSVPVSLGKPLVDTSIMVDTVTFIVEEK